MVGDVILANGKTTAYIHMKGVIPRYILSINMCFLRSVNVWKVFVYLVLGEDVL